MVPARISALNEILTTKKNSGILLGARLLQVLSSNNHWFVFDSKIGGKYIKNEPGCRILTPNSILRSLSTQFLVDIFIVDAKQLFLHQ